MLKERLIKAAEDRGAECAFVVKDLKDGSVCAYREDEVVSSFSLIKVFIKIKIMGIKVFLFFSFYHFGFFF